MSGKVEAGRLFHALAFAAQKHRDQRRKDAEASPYINHPIAVASVLAVEAGITDEDTLIAAILHDTLEDTETSSDELEDKFGPVVSGIVQEVTDDKSLPKNVRKRLHLARAIGNGSGQMFEDRRQDMQYQGCYYGSARNVVD